MKPIIGITVDIYASENPILGAELKLRKNYADCIIQAGGIPIILTPGSDVEQIASMLDGWMIPGGDDIDAKHFGQENHEKSVLQNPLRFETEKRLFNAIPDELPILGICYGCQFLNVVMGGDLIQHLPDSHNTVEHSGGPIQEYCVTPESKLGRAVTKQQIQGRSYHHQAIGRLAEGLTVTASHEDGVIEAMESTTDRWLVGVQWHPERSAELSETQDIFAAFLGAAEAFRQKRS